MYAHAKQTDSCQPKLLSLTSKPKEEFIKAYRKYDETSAKELYLQVLIKLAKTVTIQKYQRDALNIIYSSNILLYMFRVSSTHLQEDTVVHKQHMVPSLCKG